MDNQPLITVIIPVYNCEKYLESCLWSVRQQSWRKLQILVVDDGSKDGSAAICDDFAESDDRIRVFHQHNCGLSMARNRAMADAEGEYVCFVDSDDVLHPDYVRTLLNVLRKTGADASRCGADSFPADAEPAFEQADETDVCTASGYTFLKNMLDNTWNCNCWGILYRRSVIDGLEFEPGRLCEDVMFNCLAADRIKLIAFNPEKLYGYRQNPDSLMRRKLTRKSLDMLYVEEQRIRYLREKHPELLRQAKIHLTETALRFLYKIDLHAEENTAAYLRGETVGYIKRNNLSWREIFRAESSPFTRASLIGAKLSPRGTVWLNHLRKGTKRTVMGNP